MWAVVPNTSYKGVGFVRSSRDLDDWVVGMNKGIDDKVKSNYSEIGVEYPPLKIVLTPNLEMRRLLIINRDHRSVIAGIHQLSVWGD